jgi:hypothetical protein
VQHAGVEVDVLLAQGEELALPQSQRDTNSEERMQLMVAGDGEESTGLCGRPGTDLGALDRGWTDNSGDNPFDQLLSDGLAQHCAQGAVNDLNRTDAQAGGSLVGEQGANLGWGQGSNGDAAQGGEDVQTQRRSIARERRRAQARRRDVGEPVLGESLDGPRFDREGESSSGLGDEGRKLVSNVLAGLFP